MKICKNLKEARHFLHMIHTSYSVFNKSVLQAHSKPWLKVKILFSEIGTDIQSSVKWQIINKKNIYIKPVCGRRLCILYSVWHQEHFVQGLQLSSIHVGSFQWLNQVSCAQRNPFHVWLWTTFSTAIVLLPSFGRTLMLFIYKTHKWYICIYIYIYILMYTH